MAYQGHPATSASEMSQYPVVRMPSLLGFRRSDTTISPYTCRYFRLVIPPVCEKVLVADSEGATWSVKPWRGSLEHDRLRRAVRLAREVGNGERGRERTAALELN